MERLQLFIVGTFIYLALRLEEDNSRLSDCNYPRWLLVSGMHAQLEEDNSRLSDCNIEEKNASS